MINFVKIALLAGVALSLSACGDLGTTSSKSGGIPTVPGQTVISADASANNAVHVTIMPPANINIIGMGKTVEVSLLEVSRADAPAVVITKKTLKGTSTFTGPVKFPTSINLPFDRSKIDPKKRYAVSVVYLDGDKVLGLNTEQAPVLTHGIGNSVSVKVQPLSH